MIAEHIICILLPISLSLLLCNVMRKFLEICLEMMFIGVMRVNWRNENSAMSSLQEKKKNGYKGGGG